MSNVDVDAKLSLDGKPFTDAQDRIVDGVRQLQREANATAGALGRLTLNSNSFIASLERDLLTTGKSAEQKRLVSIATADLTDKERSYALQLSQGIADKERSAEAMKSLRTGMLWLGGAIGTAAASTALLVRHEINAADQMLALSQRTGMTTEALSRLAYAGEQYDLTQEQLAQGLRRLNISLVEARDGTGRAAEAFRALQIDPTKLQNSEQAVRAIAQRFADLKDGTDKSAIAMTLFGKEAGDRLVPMLNAGADGLRELGDEAERFGRVVSDDMARKADAFNDNLTRLASSVKGLAHSIAEDLLPSLVKMSDEMLEGHRIAGGWWESMRLFGTINPFREVQDNLEILKQDLANKKQWRMNIGADLPLAADLAEEIADLEKQVEFLTFQRRKQYEAKADQVLAGLAPQDFADPRDRLAGKKDEARFDPDGKGRGRGGRAAPREERVDMRGENFAGVKNEFAFWESLAEQSRTWQEAIEQDEQAHRDRLFELRRAGFDRDFISTSDAFVTGAQVLQEQREQGIVSEEEFLRRREEMTITYLARLGDAEAQAAQQRLAVDRMTLAQKTQLVSQTLAAATATVATRNKTMFEINKAAGIANSIVSTYEGASKMLSLGIWGIPLAAIVVAAGMANIAQIKSQKFGDGGGAPSLGGATPVINVNDTAGFARQQEIPFGQSDSMMASRAQPAKEKRVFNLTLVGPQISTLQLRDELMPMINEAYGDGVEFVVTTSSR